MRCGCPDSAGMCKHIAAVMYGVGNRLDQAPELLFRLREVDHEELIDQAIPTVPVGTRTSSPRIAAGDLGSIFDIEIGEDPVPAPHHQNHPESHHAQQAHPQNRRESHPQNGGSSRSGLGLEGSGLEAQNSGRSARLEDRRPVGAPGSTSSPHPAGRSGPAPAIGQAGTPVSGFESDDSPPPHPPGKRSPRPRPRPRPRPHPRARRAVGPRNHPRDGVGRPPRSRDDPHPRPDDLELAGGEEADRFGKRCAFGLEDPRGEGRGVVEIEDGNGHLEDNRAGIVSGIDEVNGAAREFDPPDRALPGEPATRGSRDR